VRDNAFPNPRIVVPRVGELGSATPAESVGPDPQRTRALGEGPDLEKRYPLALALYALLAVLVWFTMDASTVDVLGRPVEMRLVPLIVIGGFALRTVLARQADRIRRQGERD
jgi:hypothetical protein